MPIYKLTIYPLTKDETPIEFELNCEKEREKLIEELKAIFEYLKYKKENKDAS